MQENLLHFIWENRRLPWRGLFTESGECIQVHHPGTRNTDAGPDFLNADITIGDLRWSGPVEIHLKASDWYRHQHQDDRNYKNVILHLVWEADAIVCSPSGAPVPSVELKQYINRDFLVKCQELLEQGWSRFIPCEGIPKNIVPFALQDWWEALFIQRLEKKGKTVAHWLGTCKNNWEQVLFRSLARSFGARVNRDAFEELAASIPFTLVRKLHGKPRDLEAIFLGMSGLLGSHGESDGYKRELLKRFKYLARKHRLRPRPQAQPDFFRLRPNNFPTLRLSQLAALYAGHVHLFNKLIKVKTLDQYDKILRVSASSYWNTHYLFGKQKHTGAHKVSRSHRDLILLNAVFPIKYVHARQRGLNHLGSLLEVASQLPSESNRIVRGFAKAGIPAGNALTSQALIQQLEQYCHQGRCLDCIIGHRILSEL